MKTIFKNILNLTAAMAVTALAILPAAAADVDATLPVPGSTTTIISGGTNKAVALSTNSYFYISNPDATDLAFFIDFKYLNAVGSGDVNRLVMEVFRGIDGSTFESNVWQTISFAAATTTTTARSTVTNLSLAAIPNIRCRFLNLSTNSHATNITVKVKPKIPRARD